MRFKAFAVVGIFVGICGIGQGQQPFADALSPEEVTRASSMAFGRPDRPDYEAFEKDYQRLVQRQTFADLRKLYDPANQSRLEITYASFTPEGEKPGRDGGFGLHVVKRLKVDLGDGRIKIIDVNEQWPEDRVTGGLFLPDEIRIKTQVKDGPRRVEGSHQLYLFDSIRLAWDESGNVTLHRRSRYVWDDERQANSPKRMRSRISAPLACQGCHRPNNAFTAEFLEEGEAVNHEAIVQDRYFKRRLDETAGFRDYTEHLAGRDAAFRDRVRDALLAPARSMAVPGLFERLASDVDSFSWLGEDSEYHGPASEADRRQGVYRRQGATYVDALEEVIEGKYLWWVPAVVVPQPLR